MYIPVEPVQVQLVNAWWEQIIPIAALLLSLFSVALTLVFRYNERLKLAVSVNWMSMVGGNPPAPEGTDRVSIEVTNRSRSTTTEVTELTLEFLNKKKFAYTDSFPGDSTLPVTLAPGQSAYLSYPAQGLGITLNGPAKDARWVRAMAVSGHKKVRGKKSRALMHDLRTYAVEHPLPRD